MIQHFNLTLNGSVQNLLTAATTATGTSVDAQAANRPLRQILFQPAAGNGNPIYVGDDADVSATDYGIRLAAASGGVPPAPVGLGPFDQGPVKLQDFFVLGTDSEILHVLVVDF